MSEHKMYPYPEPDMDAGRSAKPISDSMKGMGQMTAAGAMGKYTKTGDGMENEEGIGGGSSHGSSHNPGSSHKRGKKMGKKMPYDYKS